MKRNRNSEMQKKYRFGAICVRNNLYLKCVLFSNSAYPLKTEQLPTCCSANTQTVTPLNNNNLNKFQYKNEQTEENKYFY